MARRAEGYLDVPEEEAIVLVGEPGVLRARVPLRNAGPERVFVRESFLRGDVLGALSAPVTRALPEVLLQPGQARLATMTVVTDPHAAPGEYRGELEVGGDVRPLVIVITEVVDLVVRPGTVIVENAPGQTVTKQLVFENRGNVTLSIAEIGPLALDDDLLECRALRRAARAVHDDERSLEKIAAEIIIQAKHVVAEIGFLRVRNEETVLGPGEVRTVAAEIRVPDRLDPRGRYRGVAPIYDTEIEFVVSPGPARAHEPSPEPPPPKATTTRRSSPSAGRAGAKAK